MTVFVIDPSRTQTPIGGLKKLYDHVDLLNEVGLDAAIVHPDRGFRPRWFANQTTIVNAPQRLTSSDILAIPESYGDALATIAPGIPRVSVNQNAFQTFRRVRAATNHPYLTCPTLVGVLVVSEHNARYVEYGFPGLPVERVRPAIDASLFSSPLGRRQKRIGYMPRRRQGEAEQVLGLLQATGSLEGWEVVPISGLDQSGVAKLLGSCALFLSFSQAEGFGLPPAEALASGCFVIGFTGFAGSEYFHPDHTVAVEDGNVLAFAEAVRSWIDTYDALHEEERAPRGSQYILSTYSRDLELSDVERFYRGAAERAKALPAVDADLRRSDLLLKEPRSRTHRTLSLVRQTLETVLDRPIG